MDKISGGLENVRGFTFSAIKCGIRYSDRIDYSLIVSDSLCNAAGVFTTNKITAAPVKLCRERINNKIKAILINSTNANACTGHEGLQNAKGLTEDIAKRIGVSPESVLMASTGIIGRQLPYEKMLSSHDELIANLDRNNGQAMARAIMTTDTIPKEVAASFTVNGEKFYIAGIAKGAGMIAPNMATLLSFILTDAPIEKNYLDYTFRKFIKKTFNSITIDGDMSTNDSAIILSPDLPSPFKEDQLADFEEALLFVLDSLAQLIVYDAEGATKSVKIRTIGAATDDDADKIARAVSQSLLVKTAIFGNDPNWGRIVCAAGYSGADINESTLSVYVEDIPLFVKGTPTEQDLKELESVLKRRNYTITIDVGLGNGESIMWTSDLSFDYVKINAEYST